MLCAVCQVFVPAEGAAAEVQVAAGMQIGSADLLYNERTIEQARILVHGSLSMTIVPAQCEHKTLSSKWKGCNSIVTASWS